MFATALVAILLLLLAIYAGRAAGQTRGASSAVWLIVAGVNVLASSFYFSQILSA